MRRYDGKVWEKMGLALLVMIGLLMGGTVGLAATSANSPTQPTSDEATFQQQLATPVTNPDQAISAVFPDPVLAQSIADTLTNGDTTKNFQAAKADFFKDPTSANTQFSLVIKQPVKDWTGLSALKGLVRIINVQQQGTTFNHKAYDLVQALALPFNPEKPDQQSIFICLPKNGIDTTTFNDLIHLDTQKHAVHYVQFEVPQNQITDLSAADELRIMSHYDEQNQEHSYDGDLRFGSYEQAGTYQATTPIHVKAGMAELKMKRYPDFLATLPNRFLKRVSGEADPSHLTNDRVNFSYQLNPTPNQSDYVDTILAGIADFHAINNPVPSDQMVLPGLADIDNTPQSMANWVKAPKTTPYAAIDDHWYEFTNLLTSLNSDPDIMSRLGISVDQFNYDLRVTQIPQDAQTLTMRVFINSTNGGGTTNQEFFNMATTVTFPLIHDADTPATQPNTGNSGQSQQPVTPGQPGRHVVPKGEAVYAVKKIGLYSQKNFSSANRRHWYPRVSRTKRPQFVVLGYARAKTGALRYRVKDVNHQTKMTGKTGYITADSRFVQLTYYQRAPRQVRVIDRLGVNAYGTKSLTKQKHHYHKGQVLGVKRLVHYHLTTRLLLNNGCYVSANKTLVVKN